MTESDADDANEAGGDASADAARPGVVDVRALGAPRREPRSGPPRWIWVTAALVVVVGFGLAIALAGSTDDSPSSSSTTSAVDAVPAAAATLGKVVLPAIEGFRISPPTSGREALSRAEIEGKADPSKRIIYLPGPRPLFGWRRDFVSTTSDDVVRVVLVEMKNAAGATFAVDQLQQWWVQQQGYVLDDKAPIGSTTAVVGTSRAADSNGDHVQIAMGSVGKVMFVVLRFSKSDSTDTSALLKVAADQSLRLQAG